MSTRSGRRSGKSKVSTRSNEWSDWTWDEAGGQYYRARLNSSEKYEYEYSLPENTTEESTPRGGAIPGNAVAFPITSAGREYYENEDYNYQHSSETSDEFNDLSERYEQTSSNVERFPSTDSAHQDGYQWNEGQRGSTSTQPISIPPNARRQDHSTSNSYSSSGHSTIVGSQSSYASEISSLPPSGYSAAGPSSYYPPAPTERLSSNVSGNIGYGSTEPSMVDSRGIPVSSMGYSTPSREYADFAAGYSTPAGGYSQYPQSITNAQSETGNAYGASAATSSRALTPKPTHMTITGTSGSKEKLDPHFKLHKSSYFKPGHVFKVLWFEPLGENARSSNATEVTDFSWNVDNGRFAERAHASIRRFVIVATDDGHSQCLPILTYQRQGTKKFGVKHEDHAIIYTGDTPPDLINGEAELRLRPIRVIPKTPRDKLEEQSRINYAKIYTVEHNVKVLFIGHVDPKYQHRLIVDFDTTWQKKRQMNPYPQDYSSSNTADSYAEGGY